MNICSEGHMRNLLDNQLPFIISLYGLACDQLVLYHQLYHHPSSSNLGRLQGWGKRMEQLVYG